MNKLNYKYETLTPFKICVLENFPFIEADFDALTNYQIMCKIVEYLNQTRNNQNLVQENIIALNNWFNTLDVQDEINNKLDNMAENGELESIIASYLNTNAILGFNTLNDLKNASNLVAGSFTETLGKNNINDGLGYKYKIRNIINTDVVDNDNLVSLNNYPSLIAEKIIDIKSKDNIIFIGDSYGTSESSWVTKIIEKMNLTPNVNAFNFCVGGAGFLDVNNGNNTYLQNLQNRENIIRNKNEITKIICCGGYNDRARLKTDIELQVQNFINYCKNNYPNAKIYVGMIANYNAIDDTAGNLNIRNHLATQILTAYKSCSLYGGIYLNGVENIMHYYGYFSDDNIHPNEAGNVELGRGIFQAVMSGDYQYNSSSEYAGITINKNNYKLHSNLNADNTAFGISGYISNNVFYLKPLGNIYFYNYLEIRNTDYSKEFELATYTTSQKWFRRVNSLTSIPVKFKAFLYNDSDYVLLDGQVNFKLDGKITITLINSSNKTAYYITRLNVIGLIQTLPMICL